MTGYTTSGAQVLTPTGSVFTAYGVDVSDERLATYNGSDWVASTANTDAAVAQLLAAFPNATLFRVGMDNIATENPAFFQEFITKMNAAGKVVEISDYTDTSGAGSGSNADDVPMTGTQLSTELSWYHSMAATYASNPMVWLGTNNEPNSPLLSRTPAEATANTGLPQWQKDTYTAIHGGTASNGQVFSSTGYTAPMFLDIPNGGYPGNTTYTGYGLPGSASTYYGGMSNVILDPHLYPGVALSGTPTVAQWAAAITAENAEARTFVSGAPIIYGEYGNSAGLAGADPGWTNMQTALTAAVSSGSVSGESAWAWSNFGADQLNDPSTGTLTTYGHQVANSFPTTTPPPPPVTPTITGAVTGQTVLDTGTISPFSGVTISATTGQTETMSVILNNAANGTLTNLGGGTYSGTSGLYTKTGTAAQVTTAIDGLVFNPTDHQGAAGTTITTGFTIHDTDNGGSTADFNTTVITTESGTAPPTNTVLQLDVSGRSLAGVDPTFTVSVDGTQVGGTYTDTAVGAGGGDQYFILQGNWDPSLQHDVKLTFTNPAGSGTSAMKFNVVSSTFNGATTNVPSTTAFNSTPIDIQVGGSVATKPQPEKDKMIVSATGAGSKLALTLDGVAILDPAGLGQLLMRGNWSAGVHDLGMTASGATATVSQVTTGTLSGGGGVWTPTGGPLVITAGSTGHLNITF